MLRLNSLLLLMLLAAVAAPAWAQDSKPWLGAKLRILEKDELTKFSVENGLYVTEVTKSSPADVAGLEVGDIILSAGEKTLSTIEQMEEVMGKKRPGDALNMGVRRENGKIEPLVVKLGTRVRVPGQFDNDKRVKELRDRIQKLKNETADLEAELEQRIEDLRSGKAKPEVRDKPPIDKPDTPPTPDEPKPVPVDPTKLKVKLSAKLVSLDSDEAKTKGLEGGVVVSSVETGGAADKAGLRSGDVIFEAGGGKITGTGDFRGVLAKLNPGDEIEVKVLRGKDTVTVKIVLAAA